MIYETIDKRILKDEGYKHKGFYGNCLIYSNGDKAMLLDRIKGSETTYNIRLKYKIK